MGKLRTVLLTMAALLLLSLGGCGDAREQALLALEEYEASVEAAREGSQPSKPEGYEPPSSEPDEGDEWLAALPSRDALPVPGAARDLLVDGVYNSAYPGLVFTPPEGWELGRLDLVELAAMFGELFPTDEAAVLPDLAMVMLMGRPEAVTTLKGCFA